jgi:hypothetical protein
MVRMMIYQCRAPSWCYACHSFNSIPSRFPPVCLLGRGWIGFDPSPPLIDPSLVACPFLPRSLPRHSRLLCCCTTPQPLIPPFPAFIGGRSLRQSAFVELPFEFIFFSDVPSPPPLLAATCRVVVVSALSCLPSVDPLIPLCTRPLLLAVFFISFLLHPLT